MNLLTKEIENALLEHPFGNQDGKGMDAEIIVKFFNPSGAGTWLITEGEHQEDGNWLLFGYCHLFEWEWGDVWLPELQSLKVPPFGLSIERDLHLSPGETVGDQVKYLGY